MKLLKLGFIAAALALFVIACSQTANVNNTNAPAANAVGVSNAQAEVTPTTAAGDELAAAGKIYSEMCVNCHKADGAGGVTVLEGGRKIKAPNFGSERMRKDDDADWIDAIENGIKDDGMPAYKGKISDDEIKNLVKYIRREFQK